jgi:hypothetical protein
MSTKKNLVRQRRQRHSVGKSSKFANFFQKSWEIEENCNNAAQDQNIFGLETKDS